VNGYAHISDLVREPNVSHIEIAGNIRSKVQYRGKELLDNAE